MSNRNFNKQTTNARQGLADGGPAGGKDDPRKRSPGPRSGRPSLADKIKKATPMPIEVDLSNPRDKVRPNPRKKLKPFPNQAVPDRPRPKLGRPSRPMPQDPIDKMEPRRPRPKLPGKPSGPKGLTPEQIKRLNELMKKRKGLDPKNPKFKKSIEDLKNQIRQRPKTMIPLKSKGKK
jgi:hypothetical protein